MTLNGITCIGYSRTAEGFLARLTDTTREAILGLSTTAINIHADDGHVVETYAGFGSAGRITEYLDAQHFEVFFPLEDKTQQRVRVLEEENSQLREKQSQMDAALDSLFLEIIPTLMG